MKIGMKGDMGVADKMVLLVLGSRARSMRNCARSAPEGTYSQFMVARSEARQNFFYCYVKPASRQQVWYLPRIVISR